ncbi:hypothetical protein [Flavobacterium anseongense]|nr:hypothetical protein [Flavobacterium sp. AS60]
MPLHTSEATAEGIPNAHSYSVRLFDKNGIFDTSRLGELYEA